MLNKKLNDINFLKPNREIVSFNEKSKNFVDYKKDEELGSELMSPNRRLDNKFIKLLIYVNEQVKFYANLSMSRNSLWRKYLEGIFPIKSIFNQINNKKLLKGIFIA